MNTLVAVGTWTALLWSVGLVLAATRPDLILFPEGALAPETAKALEDLVTRVFLLVFIMSFSSYPMWLKSVLAILSFVAVFLDVGSWWLASSVRRLSELF